jgi:hypothetical protein
MFGQKWGMQKVLLQIPFWPNSLNAYREDDTMCAVSHNKAR